MVVLNPSGLSRYGESVSIARLPDSSSWGQRPLVLVPLLAQVIEGDSEVVNVRDTDGRLGFLILVLIALGIVAIVGTVVFWWLTRPSQQQG